LPSYTLARNRQLAYIAGLFYQLILLAAMKNIIKICLGAAAAVFAAALLTGTTDKQPHASAPAHYYSFPDKADFCGEHAPLLDPIVYEWLDREIIVNKFWHSRTIQVIKRANMHFPAMERILDSMGVPADFKYLAVIESGLQNATSPSGAKGYWQFLEGTAKEYGLEVSADVDERMHVEKATLAACNYLLKAKSIFGTWTMAAAAYNMGMNGLRSVVETQAVTDYYRLHLNEETGRYIYRILATKYIFENSRQFGYTWEGMVKYTMPKMQTVPIDSSIADLRLYCTQNGYSYKELKYFNPWLISTKLSPSRDKTYYIKLPAGN
jgi:membrane-bound lytic murein transglycosylase D